MRRPGVGGFNPFQLDGFHRLRDPLLPGLQFGQLPRLFEHDLVELVILVFEVGQVRFNLVQPFNEFFFHEESLTEIKNLKANFQACPSRKSPSYSRP